jgi:AhpD family alkylhydroperoxidase
MRSSGPAYGRPLIFGVRPTSSASEARRSWAWGSGGLRRLDRCGTLTVLELSDYSSTGDGQQILHSALLARLVDTLHNTPRAPQTHMSDYQKPQDLTYAESLLKFAPKEANAFFNLKHTAERKDGVIPLKYRELMSVAVALTTQCAYCIDAHVKNAVEAGATREEVAETVFIAAALRAGGAVGNGLLAMRLFDEATASV